MGDAQECFFNVGSNQLSAGGKSLCLKHVWVYYHMVRNDLDNVVVMEDDPLFTAEAGKALRALPKELRQAKGYTTVMPSGCNHEHARRYGGPGSKKTQHLWGPGYNS